MPGSVVADLRTAEVVDKKVLVSMIIFKSLVAVPDSLGGESMHGRINTWMQHGTIHLIG